MSYAVFDATAPRVCRDLLRDLPGLTENDTFAICGNLGHESIGFTAFQEIKPTVAGSAGGWGWAQWTGMKPPSGRRYLFNKWCAEQGIKDLKSYEANYGFLLHELKTSQAASIRAVRAASTLRDKVIAFEKVFERAGVPAFDSRVKWAERARDAYNKVSRVQPTPAPVPAPAPDPAPAPAPQPAPPAPVEPPKPVEVPAEPKVIIKPKHVGAGFSLTALLAAAAQGIRAFLVVALVIGVAFAVYKLATRNK
jgi:hypothetical protein